LKNRLLLLIGGCAGMWLVLALPAFLLAGESGLIDSTTAAFLCMVPALGTLVWSELAAGKLPEQQMLADFGGMGIRMAVVLGVGIGLFSAVPRFHSAAFLLWIVVFYLATLTLEIYLVVRRQAALDKER
jgi:hypothetical protein